MSSATEIFLFVWDEVALVGFGTGAGCVGIWLIVGVSLGTGGLVFLAGVLRTRVNALFFLGITTLFFFFVMSGGKEESCCEGGSGGRGGSWSSIFAWYDWRGSDGQRWQIVPYAEGRDLCAYRFSGDGRSCHVWKEGIRVRTDANSLLF